MNDNLIGNIQSFTLAARATLERETEEQLQGLYGWLPDGTFGKGTALSLPEAQETRSRLEAYAVEEGEAGVNAAAARTKLKRETAFTWLNRAVAFRLMEERGIIKATLAKLLKSNAFIYWLTEVKGEASIPASTPVNALSEGPVDSAYREFLLWQCGQLAAEVSVLFDPATLASRLCPRPPALKELVEAMNAAELAEAWKAGNEETIGWVYQGFNTEEKAATFASFQAGKKVTAERIGAATQIFTPQWVVRYLVENSLGRLWLDLHPDSRLTASLRYLVPLKSATKRTPRSVRDITFLDPCCGSMHFGLVAFDVYAEMYREEQENAGNPGWPDKPSAATAEEIPELILTHNLHGIDIDLRAVQVSALALVLKARTLNPKAVVTDANLACANVQQLTCGQFEEFISKTQFSHPIYERVLRRLASRLKDSDHLGSLLRIEREIEDLVASERKLSADLFEQFPGFDPEQFETTEGIEEFFGILTEQIGRHLDHFVQGSGGGLFATETAKGLRFLRLVERRYDVVATNPPYLDSRDYSAVHKAYLEEQFPAAKRNLFAAFIQRCLELADPEGLVGMITGQSFMFISSYETLRERLLDETAIQTLAQFDYHLFQERVDTTAFVLRKEPEAKRREEQVGTYFRLVKERDADTKRLAFESALATLRRGEDHHRLFHYQQSDFDAIPGQPWVYWITPRIRLVFKEHPSIAEIAKPKHGMATADNFRFLRKWYEVGTSRIGFGHLEPEMAARCGRDWFPYMKGGPVILWYGNMDHIVNYGRDGLELKAWADTCNGNSGWSRNLISTGFYFRKGVTWSLISSKGFAARLSPGGFVFDAAGMTCFPPEGLLPAFLAILNCRLSRFLLSAINPTINFQVCDIERLPVPNERSPKIDDLVNQSVELIQQDSRENETTYDFVQPLSVISARSARREYLAAIEAKIDAEVSRLYGLREEDLAVIQRELDTPTASSCGGNEEEASGSSIDGEEAEVASDLSPSKWARSWVSYAIGTVLGRFEIGRPTGLGCGDFPQASADEICKLVDPDGIMPCHAGHPQDIAARADACLEVMLGAQPARDAIRTATDTEGEPVEALRGWVDRFSGASEASFWKYHYQLYRKRPVYWPFQSPNKHFTVWVFHEKLGPNTLHTIKDLAQERLNLLERSRIPALKPEAVGSKAKERELERLLVESDDLVEFIQRLQAHINTGYQSCLDDGVLLNAAPLHDLLPSWPETAKAWKDLENEKFEWAHQAMRYWPQRVTEACRTNRSFAIAHGLEHICPATPRAAGKRGRKVILEDLL